MRQSGLASLCVLLIMCGAAQADGPVARQDFDAGVEAFHDGDLDTARKRFEQARAGGLDSPSLLYNLGVVYYRLSLLDEADAVFLRLLETPHAPLARYNLGLVHQARGDSETARNWFRQAAAPASPEKIRELARRQLAEYETVSDESRRGLGRTSGYLSLAAGYDDNISGTPDDASSNQSGSFADVLAASHVYLDEPRAFRLNGLVYTRQYPKDSTFDNSYASVGTSWLDRLGSGQVVTTVSLANSWFGSESLERQLQLDVVYDFDRCTLGAVTGALACEVSASITGIRGGSGYRAYDGEMYVVAAQAGKTLSEWSFTGAYKLEFNDRRDLTTSQEFYSVSPLRHLIAAGVDYRLSDRVSLGAEMDVRFSHYADDHRLVSGMQTVSERRKDKRLSGALQAEYRMTRRWQVAAEWNLLDNRSTIGRYDYSRSEFMVGIEGVF